MKLHIRTSWVHKIDKDELDALTASLTVNRKSGIKEILDVVDHNKLWAVIAYHRGKAVGWCILECRAVCYAQVYVKKKYRGHGIGSKLLARAKRMSTRRKKKLMVAELSRSRGFFAQVAKRIPLHWHPLTPVEKPRLITA